MYKMTTNDFKNIIYHCKPHNRFIIFNSIDSEIIKSEYLNIYPSGDVKIQSVLTINDGDLIWIDGFGINIQELLENILQSAVGKFFEIISNEILETYFFTKDGDSKDIELEGSQLKRRGEIRHFLLKKVNQHFIYSTLKLWSQKIETDLINYKLPENILLNLDEIIKFRQSNFKKIPNFKIELFYTQITLTRCWIVWGIPLIFEMELEGQKYYLELENLLVDLTTILNKLEDFAQFLNCDFFEIDLQSGETNFYDATILPEWVNKFLMNSWRHGYFKYYYPQLCF